MKIIKRGAPPSEIPLQATCHHCKTEIEFVPLEAQFIADQREGDYYRIPCPVCLIYIYKNAKS